MNNEISEEPENSPFKNLFYTILTGVALLFCLAVIAGLLQSRDLFSPYVFGIITGVAIPTFVLLYILVKLYKKSATAEMSKKEIKRRNILILSGLAGGIIGALLVMQTIENGDTSLESTLYAPISTLLALSLAFIWGIIMPIICYFWYKNVDEQEMHAVRIGAYYSLYIYMIGAPTWWILWRGGLVPEPNGIIIYLVTVYSFTGIWLWKKYRG